MSQNYSRAAFLLAALFWAGLIFYLSHQPSIDMPALFPGQDKLFHLIAFGILGFFTMGILRASHKEHQTGQVWLVTIAVMLYGILDEFHQHFVPGRTADVYDVLADAIGGLLGGWTLCYLASVLVRQSPNN